MSALLGSSEEEPKDRAMVAPEGPAGLCCFTNVWIRLDPEVFDAADTDWEPGNCAYGSDKVTFPAPVRETSYMSTGVRTADVHDVRELVQDKGKDRAFAYVAARTRALHASRHTPVQGPGDDRRQAVIEDRPMGGCLVYRVAKDLSESAAGHSSKAFQWQTIAQLGVDSSPANFELIETPFESMVLRWDGAYPERGCEVEASPAASDQDLACERGGASSKPKECLQCCLCYRSPTIASCYTCGRRCCRHCLLGDLEADGGTGLF